MDKYNLAVSLPNIYLEINFVKMCFMIFPETQGMLTVLSDLTQISEQCLPMVFAGACSHLICASTFLLNSESSGKIPSVPPQQANFFFPNLQISFS